MFSDFDSQPIKDLANHAQMFDKRRVFLSEIRNINSIDCIVSKVKIAQVSPNVRWCHELVFMKLCASLCIICLCDYTSTVTFLIVMFFHLLLNSSWIWRQKRELSLSAIFIMT